jgi:hypothetical protein
MATSSSFGDFSFTFIEDPTITGLRPEMKYFNTQLFKEYSPDLTGYVLIFFIPPPFTMLPSGRMWKILSSIRKFATFAAVDFTPPQNSITSTTVSPRVGGLPFAMEAGPTQQCTVTFLDNNELSIYSFHLGWYEYIRGLLEGLIPKAQPGEFFEMFPNLFPDENGEIEDGLDYAGSFFVVKYDPSMSLIKYVGKATGVFPQNMPSKELIGQRTSNEIVTLPFTYYCSFYDEATSIEHPIWKELKEHLIVFDIGGTIDDKIT